MCFKFTHIYKHFCSFCVIVAYKPAHLIDFHPFCRPVRFVLLNICSEQRFFLIFFFLFMLINHVISFRLLWISVCSFFFFKCIFTILLSSTNFSTLASTTSGQRLLRKADFHLGQHINTFFRIRCKMTENSADRKHLQGAEKRHITMFGTYLSITYRFPPLSEPLISISPNV